MPRNPTTGVFTRVSNSFSDPIAGTVIDPVDANALFDDYDLGLSASIPEEPTTETGASIVVSATEATVAIERTGPTATAITLPSVVARDGQPLQIVDWSTSVVSDHIITITPAATETIMRQATFTIVSNSSQLSSIRLYPSTVLNGWFQAP